MLSWPPDPVEAWVSRVAQADDEARRVIWEMHTPEGTVFASRRGEDCREPDLLPGAHWLLERGSHSARVDARELRFDECSGRRAESFAGGGKGLTYEII